MKIDKYYCKDGVATPVNNYSPFDKNGEYDGNQEFLDNFNEFETFAQSNTVSCPEDLMGEYGVTDVEIVWQSRLRGAIKWNDVLPEAYERSNNDFDHYREYCDTMDAFARQFLQLKPVVKKEPEVAISDLNELYKCIKDFEGFSGVKYTKGYVYRKSEIHISWQSNFTQHFEPEVKQQFGEWISCSERMPETESLLLTTSKKILIGDWYDGIWRVSGKNRWAEKIEGGFELLSDLRTGDITHHMPLPSPPKSI